MTRNLRWYASRLHAMSVAEVVHRGYRAARYPLVRLRGQPRPSAAMRTRMDRWEGPEPFYFDRELCATAASPEILAEAERICDGKRRVLGLGWLDVPAERWHHEPSAAGSWPRVDAARVIRAAPAHFDPRLTWELNRGHEWVVLARVHAATGDRRLLDRLVAEIAAWRRENPIGVGINWVSAMEAAIRVHSLVWSAGFLRGTSVLPLLAETIYEHVRFVASHLASYSSANNHLIVELSALIVAALTLGGDLASLHAGALARLIAEVDRQVFADGVSAEMATHYHVFVLESLLLVAYLLRVRGVPRPELDGAIERMVDYLAAVRCGDGTLLQQGDSDDGCVIGLFRPRHADQILAAAQRPPAASTRHEGAFWITNGAPRSVPETVPRSRLFAASGQVILRSARIHAAFDAGPFGFDRIAAHAHCDALAITLAVDGRRMLVDRGTYRYSGDRRLRDWYRQTAAHNTAQIGGLEQASSAGPFLWSRRPTVTLCRCDLTERGDIVEARHDGFPGWSHRRTLVRHRDVLVILDRFLGTATAEPVVARCHLAPELAVTRSPSHRWAVARAWLLSSARTSRLAVSAHSDAYAKTTTAATIELADRTDRTLVTAIGPADVSPEVALDELAQFAAANGVVFTVPTEVARERAQ